MVTKKIKSDSATENTLEIYKDPHRANINNNKYSSKKIRSNHENFILGILGFG